jgi:hypothetical protein
MKVKTSIPPRDGKGWTVLLECGHTIYDVKSKKRPQNVNCELCQHPRVRQ